MLSEKHDDYFDVAHTRRMLFVVHTHTRVKCGVFINNLIQNVRTGRPPNALPSSTQSYLALLLYRTISPLYRTLCKLQRTSVDGAIDRCCFLFFYILSCRPVSAAFRTPNSIFFDERPSLNFLLAFFSTISGP